MKKPSLLIRDEIVKTFMKSKKPLRWKELLKRINEKRKIEGNPILGRATLANHLKILVNEGIIKRTVDQSVYPPAVYYSLQREVDEETPSEVVEAWIKGAFKPLYNPWHGYFFIFTDPPININELPLKSAGIIKGWLSRIFAELDHVIRSAYRDQVGESLSKKVLEEAEYYKRNREYVWWFNKRIKNHGIIKAVDEYEDVQKKMYSVALRQLFEEKFLVVKNKNHVEFKSDEEIVEILALDMAKRVLEAEYGKDLLSPEGIEERKREYLKRFKAYSQMDLIRDCFDDFLRAYSDSALDLKYRPNINDPYFLIWLANKRNPAAFKDFPLLPKEVEEYKYLKRKIEETRRSFEKYSTYYLKPISLLITAQIPMDFP
ncbi:MAG: hypothetical protein ACP5IM_06410 [Candidatus Bathyarchaeia archaeon]